MTHASKRLFVSALLAAPALALVACSKEESKEAGGATLSPVDAYAKVAAEGKGFTVGALMAANAVYVMFDPQCPHCGHLWQASQPLLNKVKFVWVPVSFINGKSAPQGAALLSAANPVELMNAHESSLLAGTGGIALPSDVPATLEATIKTNTQLLNSFGVASVPYVLAKNLKTGEVVSNAGAMETAKLAEFVGLN
jgi:thiol:disulfide interchange protein DsbG